MSMYSPVVDEITVRNFIFVSCDCSLYKTHKYIFYFHLEVFDPSRRKSFFKIIYVVDILASFFYPNVTCLMFVLPKCLPAAVVVTNHADPLSYFSNGYKVRSKQWFYTMGITGGKQPNFKQLPTVETVLRR